MPNINSLTYNGMKSTDLGVYVTGSGSFDAAEMDADKYEIAGRNGDLIIPKNRYKNIVVTYPAFIPKAFQEKAQSIRNWMRSAKTYARLEDTYDMEHYRLGLASGIQSFEPVNRNDASNFQLSFDCKPQRFLKTGETPLPIEPEAHSYSGEIVEFETVAVDDMTKAEVSLSPIQSLNGYDHPWAGGAGKNKLRAATTAKTVNTITFTPRSDGSVAISGTNTRTAADFYLIGGTNTYENVGIPSGDYVISGNSLSTDYLILFVVEEGGTIVAQQHSDYNIPITFDATKKYRIFLRVPANAAVPANTVAYPMIRESGTPVAYEPWQNLCPITGHTGATLNVTGKNLNPNTGVNYSTNNAVRVFLKAGAYTISTDNGNAPGENNAIYIGLYDAETGGNNITNGNLTSSRFHINSSGTFYYGGTNYPSSWFTILIDCWVAIGFNNQIPTNFGNLQLELGSTATAYTPYVGNQYTATFGQTVYGGTFDFVSGKLVVNMASVDLGTLTWDAYSDSIGQYFRTSAGWSKRVDSGGVANMLCEALKTVSSSNVEDGCIARSTGGSDWLYARYLACADAASFKTAMSGVQLVYELKTPIEIDLDPTEVQTLLGLNNVWASDGTVEINYADPFNVDNPTYFEARPLFEITNPAQNDVLNVNGKTITFLSSYTGTVTIDCETMNCFSGYTNLNYLISATDFLVLNEGVNIATWSGSGTCKMTPRWWEL